MGAVWPTRGEQPAWALDLLEAPGFVQRLGVQRCRFVGEPVLRVGREHDQRTLGRVRLGDTRRLADGLDQPFDGSRGNAA